jgi:hypothetical protein
VAVIRTEEIGLTKMSCISKMNIGLQFIIFGEGSYIKKINFMEENDYVKGKCLLEFN